MRGPVEQSMIFDRSFLDSLQSSRLHLYFEAIQSFIEIFSFSHLQIRLEFMKKTTQKKGSFTRRERGERLRWITRSYFSILSLFLWFQN